MYNWRQSPRLLFGVSFLLEWFPHYGEGGVKPNSPLCLLTKWGLPLSHKNTEGHYGDNKHLCLKKNVVEDKKKKKKKS